MKKNDVFLFVSTLMYSFLFYQESAGINFLIFNIIFIGGLNMIFSKSMLKKNIIIAEAGALISAISILMYGNGLSVFANITSLSLIAGLTINANSSVIIALINSVIAYGSSVVFMFIDLFKRKKANHGSINKRAIWAIVIPILITIIFFFIYQGSNPVFYEYTKDINLDFISFLWVLFTISGFLIMYGVLYMNNIAKVNSWEKNLGNNLNSSDFTDKPNGIFGFKINIKTEQFSGILLLTMLNILILSMNIFDLNFFTTGNIPEGITYSDFLHQGIGLLILSIIIAISIILFYFRGALNFEKSKTLKILALIWIVQNALMIISNIYRNNLYIEEYTLTYKRIGVYVYLTLSIAGLVTTFIKIIKNKSNWYLFGSNSWIAYFVLILSSLINWDYQITNYNINNSKNTDLDYLLELSYRNLPELINYKPNTDTWTDNHFIDYSNTFSYRYNYSYKQRSQVLAIKLYEFLKDYNNQNWKSYCINDKSIYKEIKMADQNQLLNKIDLQNQYLADLKPLYSIINIKDLNISNNYITNLNELLYFPNLEKLNYDRNNLYDIDSLPTLNNLKEISLSGNYIRDFSYLKNLPLLETLDISDNQNTDIHSFPIISTLKSLNISGNTIQTSILEKKFPALITLNISGIINKSNEIPQIPSLEYLYAYNNNLNENDIYYLKNLSSLNNLKELNLSGNGFKNIYNLTELLQNTNIESLDLANNQMLNIQGIEKLLKLSNLNLYNNLITNIEPISQLTLLKTLDLSGNNIYNDSVISNLTNLNNLNLRGCKISNIDWIACNKKLETLNLSENNINNIHNLNELTNLKTLYLSNNNINDISVLKDLTQLETLSLSSNNIKDYSPLFVLKQLKQLTINRVNKKLYKQLKDNLPNTKISTLN